MRTLSYEHLAAYRNQGGGHPRGKYREFFCPLCGSAKRSLLVNPGNGRFKCYACLATGLVKGFPGSIVDPLPEDVPPKKTKETIHTLFRSGEFNSQECEVIADHVHRLLEYADHTGAKKDG